MKILIIEDEKPAAEKLKRHILKYDPNTEILAVLPSIKESISWFNNNQQDIDLIFSDIQLTDGLSFNIFKEIQINKPIIFTTAFSEYAIEAFKANGIDYLLKPITYEAVADSMKKLDLLRDNLTPQKTQLPIEQLSAALSQLQKNYKGRFMVKVGEHIRSVTVDNIATFFSEGRNVFLITFKQRKFNVDYKMEELENVLDPKLFFRVNRSFIININAIQDVLVYSKSRLKISTETEQEKEIIVSRDKVNAFKNWFNDA